MFSLFIVYCLRWEVECLDAIGSTWLNDRKGIWPVKKSALHIPEDSLAGPVHQEQLCNKRRARLHTHTHHTFNGSFSRTTWMSWYQKGETNLDFTQARDSEWQWHQLGHQSAPLSRQITTPATHYSNFYRPDALPAAQPTVSKH